MTNPIFVIFLKVGAMQKNEQLLTHEKIKTALVNEFKGLLLIYLDNTCL